MRLLKYLFLLLSIVSAYAPTIDSYPNTGTLSSGDMFLLEAANRTTYRNITWAQFQALISPLAGSGTFITVLATTNIANYAYITNLYSTTINASTNINNYDFTTNLFVTNITAQTINAVTNFNTYEFVTNLFATNITAVTINATTNFNTYQFTTNLYATNIYATTINAVTNISDFFFTTNLFVTNLFTTVIDATTNINNYAFITNLFATNIYTTNLFATTINATTNINNYTFTTNLYTTNLFATTVNAVTNISDFFFTTNLFVTNLFATTIDAVTNINNYAFITNLYTTNLFATTVNAVTNISNFDYITNLYVTNLTVQNFNLVSNSYVLAYGGYGTNETFVGTTTFQDTNVSGTIAILDADGTTTIAGFSTNNGGFFGRGYAVSTNSWSGPTNVVDLTRADTYYTTLLPVSLTGVAGKLGTYSSGVSLTINNASGSNVTVNFATFTTSDGSRSAVATNGQNTVMWIKYSPVGPQTNLVLRPFF